MNKYMIHVLNSVFMHYTRKTLRNNQVKHSLDYSIWQDWFRKRSNVERRFKNFELLNEPLAQTLIDFDKAEQHLYEKYDVKIMTERNWMLFCGRNIFSNYWQTYGQHTGESVQDGSWKVGRIQILVASLHARETTFGDNMYDQDSHFKARNRDEDTLAMGAPSNGKAKGKCEANAKSNPEKGDCIGWTTKGQRSYGEACAFKHDPTKKDKGKERRSLSPTGSPHRKSKGDGKGRDDGNAKGTKIYWSKFVRESERTTLYKL